MATPSTKVILGLGLFLTLWLKCLPSALAQDQFIFDYASTYSIADTGETTVTQNITIENSKADVVAKSYAITIKDINIYDISATAKDTKIKLEPAYKKTETDIKILLEDPIIGLGKKNELTLVYKTKDLAIKTGKIWHVSIPKLGETDGIRKNTIELIVPDTLGPEIFISPQPTLISTQGAVKTYSFGQQSVTKVAISAAFGTYQVFNFKISYDLENPTSLPQTKELALVPNVFGYQQTAILSISPTPKELKTDQDGNTLAVFEVKPKDHLLVETTGGIRLLTKQINPSFGGAYNAIPSELIAKYTKPAKFWEVENPQIQSIAAKLTQPHRTVAQNAQTAYFFALQSLDYNFELSKAQTVARKGAVAALATPISSGCMDFSDVTLTLLRAMGIPARELNGYAITDDETRKPLSLDLKNGDVLHAWLEFFDPEFGWVQIDPTWGNTSEADYFTKLDTNHIVFAVKGLDSEYPLPAGSYKATKAPTKQIYLDFSQTTNEQDFDLDVKVNYTKTLNPLKVLQNQKAVLVSNISKVAIYVDTATNSISPIKKPKFVKIELPLATTQLIYLNKTATDLTYFDATGKSYKLNVDFGFTNFETGYQVMLYVGGIFLALALCMIFWKAITHWWSQKR